MSEQFRLNPELEQLESELRGISLPAASIDRDELLFQSGWAAGVAHCGGSRVRKTSPGWMWPAVSTVFATTAAVLAVMLFVNVDSENGLEVGSNQAPGAKSIPDDGDDESMQDEADHYLVQARPDPTRIVESASSLSSASLLVRNRAPFSGRHIWPEPSEKDAGAWKSQRELLGELLPAGGP